MSFKEKRKPPANWLGFYETAIGLLLLFIIFGSLYPFEFDLSLTISRVEGLNSRPGKSDLIANIALFAPLGFAIAAVATRNRRLLLLAIALLVSIGSQIAQIYLAARFPALWDVVFNCVGLAIGWVVAGLIGRQSTNFLVRCSVPVLIPVIAFVGYELAPFIPSLDLGLLKIAIRQLISRPLFDPTAFLINCAYVLIIGSLLKWDLGDKHGKWVLTLLIAAIIIIRPITAAGQVSIPSLAGLFVGALIAWNLRPAQRLHALLMAAAIVIYIHDGLTPLTFRAEIMYPELSPLSTLINGSWLATLIALLWKTFLFSAALTLSFASGFSRKLATFTLVATAALVEGMQIVLTSGTPSTIDIFLATGVAWVVYRSIDESPRGETRPAKPISP